MRRRVRTVLLLGSRYEAFVLGQAAMRNGDEEEPFALNVAPQFIQAETSEQALALVQDRRIDLVISSLCLRDTDPHELVREIKCVNPFLPAVLVTSNPAYWGPLIQAPPLEPYDWVLSWRGEDDLIPSIILMLEDRLNADHDVMVGGVQVVLLIEDEPALYSKYLPMLFRELSERSRDLIPPDATAPERQWRERARTKLLLARTYEEALLDLSRYGDALCGVLSDMQYPRHGKLDAEAGLRLARHVKEHVRESLPVIVQSRDEEVASRAHQAGAFFVWKNSDHLLLHLRRIMLDYFGFGAFIFRDAAGAEVARARDLEELAGAIERLPFEVFERHGSRDHFSTWLFIHGEHELARRLRVIKDINAKTRAQAIELIREAAIDPSRPSWLP